MTATPLPEPDVYAYNVTEHINVLTAFSADKMRAHELAGYKRGLEAAAKVFEPAETSEHRYYAMHIRSLGEQK